VSRWGSVRSVATPSNARRWSAMNTARVRCPPFRPSGSGNRNSVTVNRGHGIATTPAFFLRTTTGERCRCIRLNRNNSAPSINLGSALPMFVHQRAFNALPARPVPYRQSGHVSSVIGKHRVVRRQQIRPAVISCLYRLINGTPLWACSQASKPLSSVVASL